MIQNMKSDVKNEVIDYLVIGGSVAGSELAAKFAKHGNTLFVDRYIPGTLMNCGGGMPKKVFNKFGVDVPKLTIEKAVMKIGKRKHSFPCNYYVVNRSEFDNALYKKACDAGATFRKLNFVGYNAEDSVAFFKDKKKDISIKYNKLILANGFHPGIEPFTRKRVKEKRGAAMVEIIDLKTPYKDVFYFEIYQKTAGYSWLFPMPDGKINVGTGGFFRDFKFKDIFKDFKELENISGEVVVKGGGVLPLKPVKKIEMGDVSLFGDSAGMVNALNGEGLMHIQKFSDKFVNALVSGKNLNSLWRRSSTYWYLRAASTVLNFFLFVDKVFKIQLYSNCCKLVIFVRNLLPARFRC